MSVWVSGVREEEGLQARVPNKKGVGPGTDQELPRTSLRIVSGS